MISLQQEYLSNPYPYWLATIALPEGITIRLCHPEPVDAQLSISDSEGREYIYTPGLLSGEPNITHSLLDTIPSVNLSFKLPTIHNKNPVDLSWDRAEAEVAVWFPGTLFEDRRVLIGDGLQSFSIGSINESIDVTIAYNTKDRGSLLPDETRITYDSWSDCTLIPEGNADTYDQTTRRRAYFSFGQYYGEIVGYPKYAVCRVVANSIDANYATATAYTPFKAIVCDGFLSSGSAGNPSVIHAHSRQNFRETTSFTPYVASDETDTGRIVTVIDVMKEVPINGVNLRWHPSTITTDPARFVALWPYGKGSSLSVGDMIKQNADNDTYYRIVTKFDDNHFEDSTLYGVVQMDEEYGGLAAQESAEGEMIPLIAEDNKIFFYTLDTGGRPSLQDPGVVLEKASDVLWTYLQRSKSIKIDLESIRTLAKIDGYKFSGQILEGTARPYDWVRKHLTPLLPVASTWTGKGFTLKYLDYSDRTYTANLLVGTDGIDGVRLSKRPNIDTSSVFNDITVKYLWDAEQEHYTSEVRTFQKSFSPQAAISGTYNMNSRALESIELYGKRTLVVEAYWISSEDVARRVCNDLANRYWKPRWRVLYKLVPKWGWLEVGDTVQFTDSEMGVTDAVALIAEITYTSSGPVVLLEEKG